MQALLVDARTRRPLETPYLIRILGWSLERYLEEAPENVFWQFVREEVIMHSSVHAEHQFRTLEGDRYRVQRLSQGCLESRILPGFWLDVAWLFQTPLPPEGDILSRFLSS